MPFSTTKEQAPATNIDVKEEHRQIVEKINAKHAEYAKMHDVSEELKTATRTLETTQKSHKSLKIDHENAKTIHAGILRDIEIKRSELAKLESDSKKAMENLQTTIAQVQTHERTTKNLTDGIETFCRQAKEAEEAKNTAVADSISAKTNFHNAKTAHEEMLKEFSDQKKAAEAEIVRFNNEKSETESALTIVKLAITAAQTDLDAISAERTKIQENNAKIIEAAELEAARIVAEAQEKAAITEKNLIEREGMISKREKWQAEYQQKLLAFKEELEKLSNRKLPINIQI